jgi:hypothetical protein
MIQDHTIDQALIELARTMAALKSLRRARKGTPLIVGTECIPGSWTHSDQVKEHAAALRASMDLTRKLADLRQGR